MWPLRMKFLPGDSSQPPQGLPRPSVGADLRWATPSFLQQTFAPALGAGRMPQPFLRGGQPSLSFPSISLRPRCRALQTKSHRHHPLLPRGERGSPNPARPSARTGAPSQVSRLSSLSWHLEQLCQPVSPSLGPSVPEPWPSSAQGGSWPSV